jgi:Zn-dependent oligopeptidase
MSKKVQPELKIKINKSNLNKNKKEKNKEEWEDLEEMIQDPLVLKKQGITYLQKKDISYYKKKIIDEKYMEHAINRIAMELSHFILKDR